MISSIIIETETNNVAKHKFSMFHQAINKQYLFFYSKRLWLFTELVTFDLSGRSLLRLPEHLSTPVITEELVLTYFTKS